MSASFQGVVTNLTAPLFRKETVSLDLILTLFVWNRTKFAGVNVSLWQLEVVPCHFSLLECSLTFVRGWLQLRALD